MPIIGFLMSLLVIVVPILVMGGEKGIFISLEGIIVVIIGTIAFAVTGYPFSKLKEVLRITSQANKKSKENQKIVLEECYRIAHETRGERQALKDKIDEIQFPFLKEGVQLLVDRLDDDLEAILTDRIRTAQEELESISNILRKLAQIPPALGLLATVLSLVHTLQGIGGGAVGLENLGPSMAVGLVGTLYGIVLANLVLSPLAEAVSFRASSEAKLKQIAFVALILISQKKSTLLVQESLNSLVAKGNRFEEAA